MPVKKTISFAIRFAPDEFEAVVLAAEEAG